MGRGIAGYTDLTRAQAAATTEPGGRDEAAAVQAKVALFHREASQAFRQAFGIGAGGINETALTILSRMVCAINTEGGHRVQLSPTQVVQKFRDGDTTNINRLGVIDCLQRCISWKRSLEDISSDLMRDYLTAADLSLDNLRDCIAILVRHYKALSGTRVTFRIEGPDGNLSFDGYV